MKSRILRYLKNKQDHDIINLIVGLFHESYKNHQWHIPFVCIILIILFWNNCVIDCALRLNQFRRKMEMQKVPHATTWINIKKYVYKIVIKFGEFRIVNLYPLHGTFSITDPQTTDIKQQTKSFIMSSFGEDKTKWSVPLEAQNKSLKIIFEMFYPTACETCQQQFGSQSYIKIWIFHGTLDFMGGFVTQLDMSKLRSDEIIEIICWQGKIHSQGMLDVYKCFCYGWEIESEEHWRNKLCI